MGQTVAQRRNHSLMKRAVQALFGAASSDTPAETLTVGPNRAQKRRAAKRRHLPEFTRHRIRYSRLGKLVEYPA